VATTDLDATLITVRNAGIDPGQPVSMSRGDLHWRLALRPDGSLACDGVFPILIEWPEGVNPVSRMQDQGLRLTRLHLMHPEVARISTAFQALGMAGPVCLSQGAAALQAEMCVADRQFHLK
ncbi:MAG: VOC family protein, partial [Granulosicoccus sp.]|nr:VOC family protein [Granulosicoccus sp.]